MPRTTAIPYQCPSCGYETPSKVRMRRHLYTLKNHCPKTVNDLTLTDAIKEYILENRVYHFKKQKTPHTVINNQYNQMNNVLSNMDLLDKITSYAKQSNVEMIDFAEKVEKKYEQQVEELQQHIQD
jgi:hypothetical protein